MRRRKFTVVGLACMFIAVLSVGCGGGQPQSKQPTKFHEYAFHPENFGDPTAVTNRWLPLQPGTQWVREGTTLIGNRKVPYQVITTVTDASRVIQGVKTLMVYDHELGAGQITQESIDYLAADKFGNVWYFGAATRQYEAGRYVAVDEAWLSGKTGKGGVLMPADPSPKTLPWSIAKLDSEDGDVAEVVRIGAKCAPFRCYPKVLVVREGKRKAIDNEFKYYAIGVGQIRNAPRDSSRHEDTEALINQIQLTPAGLTEFSNQALAIDAQAAHDLPELYGKVRAGRMS